MYAHTVNWNTAAALALYEAKKDARLTYEELHAATGISAVSIKRYLTQARPVSIEDFASIARALGRDPMELFADAEARVKGQE